MKIKEESNEQQSLMQYEDEEDLQEEVNNIEETEEAEEAEETEETEEAEDEEEEEKPEETPKGKQKKSKNKQYAELREITKDAYSKLKKENLLKNELLEAINSRFNELNQKIQQTKPIRNEEEISDKVMNSFTQYEIENMSVVQFQNEYDKRYKEYIGNKSYSNQKYWPQQQQQQVQPPQQKKLNATLARQFKDLMDTKKVRPEYLETIFIGLDPEALNFVGSIDKKTIENLYGTSKSLPERIDYIKTLPVERQKMEITKINAEIETRKQYITKRKTKASAPAKKLGNVKSSKNSSSSRGDMTDEITHMFRTGG